jgi:ribosome-associated protein
LEDGGGACHGIWNYGRKRKIQLRRKLEIVKTAALEKKAQDFVALNLKGICSFADAFIICHGQQARQTQAIADAVEEALKKKKILPSHREGYQTGEWILIDYSDLVVHVFTKERREFFSLERFWGDAPRLEVAETLKKKRSSSSRTG